ncbi:MAG: pseudaminic acid cytidylyltransferase, partial [Gammaproteobacteria bacterium]|nr:pseudaminic acid cytidylyltransferase [Gammaproteobacteria bacterium]
MKIAVIPARGGSKRISGKNIKTFAGKPLIAYSLAAANASGLFDDIIVSTDSDDIAQVARDYGATQIIRRPE